MVVVGLVWVMGFGGCLMVGLVLGVVVAIMVVWKRERYDGLGFRFCLGLNPRLWWWWVVERERKRKRNKDEERCEIDIFILFYCVVNIILMY